MSAGLMTGTCSLESALRSRGTEHCGHLNPQARPAGPPGLEQAAPLSPLQELWRGGPARQSLPESSGRTARPDPVADA